MPRPHRREAKGALTTVLLLLITMTAVALMEDPDLDECWGPVPPPDDPKTRKQLLYTNMIVAEWAMSFETKALPEVRLRANANEMFQGRVGRDYWRTARKSRLSTSAGRRERRFHEILDEEYNRARPVVDPPVTERTGAVRGRLLWMAGGAVGVVVCRLLRGRRAASGGSVRVRSVRRRPR